jgi:hypothetical protein
LSKKKQEKDKKRVPCPNEGAAPPVVLDFPQFCCLTRDDERRSLAAAVYAAREKATESADEKGGWQHVSAAHSALRSFACALCIQLVTFSLVTA